LVDGKIYIGQSTKDGIDFEKYYGSGVRIKAAVNKYGVENFSKEILLECDCQADLNEAEIFFIKEYNSVNGEIGYNVANGGYDGLVGFKHSDESKQMMSESTKKRVMGLTPEQRSECTKKGWCEKRKKELIERNKKYLGQKNKDRLITMWNNLSDEDKEKRKKIAIAGGKAKMNKMTTEQRKELSRKAANILWSSMTDGERKEVKIKFDKRMKCGGRNPKGKFVKVSK
jgi:group I intron endonuclease